MLNLTRKKEYKQKKSNDKDGKPLYKLINNTIQEKAMEKLRNRTNIKLVKNEQTI